MQQNLVDKNLLLSAGEKQQLWSDFMRCIYRQWVMWSGYWIFAMALEFGCRCEQFGSEFAERGWLRWWRRHWVGSLVRDVCWEPHLHSKESGDFIKGIQREIFDLDAKMGAWLVKALPKWWPQKGSLDLMYVIGWSLTLVNPANNQPADRLVGTGYTPNTCTKTS